MTNEEAQKEYLNLLTEWGRETDAASLKIKQESERNGTLIGLGAHQEIFEPIREKYMKLIKELQQKVDE